MKSYKKVAVCVLAFYLMTGKISAQNIGINATGAAPHASALLEIGKGTLGSPDALGLLIPRVNLTITTSNAPIGAGIATSLMVYNNATVNDVTPGYYYWNGTVWVRFSTGSGSGSAGWEILGNTGTVSGTNFLGTIDNQDLDIRTNNTVKLRVTTKGQLEIFDTPGPNNILIGEGAGESQTTWGATFIGHNSGFNSTNCDGCTGVGHRTLYSNITGDYNTALGYNSLYTQTSGLSNVAVGYYSMFSNQNGDRNVAVGREALNGLTARDENVAVGFEALLLNCGDYNTAVGSMALNSTVSTATFNTAVGKNALRYTSSGIYNSGIGSNVLNGTTTGRNNSAIGNMAGFVNSTGDYNTFLGNVADAATSALINATAIGNGAIVNASDKVRIGNTSVTAVEGPVIYTVSDGRFKENVTEEVKGLEFIKLLRPVVYNFNTKTFEEFLTKSMTDDARNKHFEGRDFARSTAIRQSGFIAQEVEKAAREAGYDFNGIHKAENETDNYSLAYAEFVVPLVKAVQEQQAIIESQQKQIADLKRTMESFSVQLSK